MTYTKKQALNRDAASADEVFGDAVMTQARRGVKLPASAGTTATGTAQAENRSGTAAKKQGEE